MLDGPPIVFDQESDPHVVTEMNLKWQWFEVKESMFEI